MLAPGLHGQGSSCVSTWPGMHTALLSSHSLHSVHASHPHVLLQMRERVWNPQAPHACVSVSSSPGGHCAVWPVHSLHSVHSDHSHESLQVRVRVCIPSLQSPQGFVSMPVVPAVHAPPPVHSPSSIHTPSTHRWR